MLIRKFKKVIADIKASNAKRPNRKLSLWAIAALIFWAIALSKVFAGLVL